MIINEDSFIIDILRNIPDSYNIFNKYHMSCLSCINLQHETLAQGCLMHGIDTSIIINELNVLY